MSTADRRTASSPAPAPVVVLLHGLGLGAWAMARVDRALQARGFRTVNLSYASIRQPFESLVKDWLPTMLARHDVALAPPGPPLHFVTQSMGGLLVRGWLRAAGVPPALHRVVMFAPPHHGTPLVDRLAPQWWFPRVLGVNAPRLGTGEDSLAATLGAWPATVELGIIAGDRPVFGRLSRWTDEPHDGKVPVASTRLDGMRDHVVLPYSHTWLQYHRPAIEQAVAFLETGRFRSVPR